MRDLATNPVKKYKEYKQNKADRGRIGQVIAAVVVIVIIVVAVTYYLRTPSTSDFVDCGILKYAIFPAESVIHGTTTNVSLTMTTIVSFTTTTSPGGKIGVTYSNQTTVNETTFAYGVMTICKYISSTSFTTSSNSSSSSSSSSVSSSSA